MTPRERVDLLMRHVAVLEAYVDLMAGSLAALKVALAELAIADTPPPTVRVETPTLPDRCHAFPSASCGLANDDARLSRSSFGSPTAWKCAGCDERFER
jgi:hypothetical protein